MCGIFCILNNTKITENVSIDGETTYGIETDKLLIDNHAVETSFNRGVGRGPETSKLIDINETTTIGFHRLAINGLNTNSDQPIIQDNIHLICNGEIYNYKELYNIMPDCKPSTDSDCEVIIHLYKRYGIEQTLNMLDGVFAFIIIDMRKNIEEETCKEHRVIVARDPYGVRPLYMLKPDHTISDSEYNKGVSNTYGFASEMKSLISCKHILQRASISQFQPGTYSEFKCYISSLPTKSLWTPVKNLQNIQYNRPGFNSQMIYKEEYLHRMQIVHDIQNYLTDSVTKRVLVTDRPVACLLSGGLDSSLITALVNETLKKTNTNNKLETYSIGIEGAADLAYAKKVADYLGTKHTEVILTEQEFFDAIPEVIRSIESYDTTTVRASIGNYLIGKYISQNSEAKVIMNGDGSDELCGGYLYFHKITDPIEFDKETRHLINNIYSFDVLRSDKSISSHGLEPRTPFLDRSWVSFYLGIHPSHRCHSGKGLPEKYLLRNAFSELNYKAKDGRALLPDEILWRTKEAFSDGVSNTARSLYEIIQEKIENDEIINANLNNFDWSSIKHNPPTTKEQKYYRYIFESEYRGCGNVIPYFWMPRFSNATDSSARTLSYYKEVQNNSSIFQNISTK
jgi:asparagine synthase (glutamine-hydrolysing)